MEIGQGIKGDELISQAERQMVEELRLHRHSEVISKVGKKSSAVCRLNERGSGVLITRKFRKTQDMPVRINGEPVCPAVGVILTTPYVLPDAETAEASCGVFEIFSLRDQKEWETTSVRLLPTVLFTSSLPESSSSSSKVGYVLVACELYGSNGKVVDAAPLGLPICAPFTLGVKAGDICLIIQHPNGVEPRKYHLTTATEVHDNHVVHVSRATPQYTASGGAVFNDDGEFVGIGHMANGAHVTINLHTIVSHMFRFGLLRYFDAGLGDSDPMLIDKYTCLGEEKEDPTSDGQVVYWKDIWNSWYDPERYGTVVLLLQAFYYHRELALLALHELACHQQRFNIKLMSSLGAIDVIIHVMRFYRDDVDVTCQAVSTLGSAADHEDNLRNIEACDTLPLLIQNLEEYAHKPRVLEWTACVLSSLFTSGERSAVSKDTFTALGGIPLLAKALRAYRNNSYLAKRAAAAFGSLADSNVSFASLCLDEEVHFVLSEILTFEPYRHEEASCIEAVLNGLVKLIEDSSLECCRNAAAALIDQGILKVLSDTLRHWSKVRSEGVLCRACELSNSLSLVHPPSVPISVDCGMEELLFKATAACPSSTLVLKSAVAASKSIGVNVEVKCM